MAGSGSGSDLQGEVGKPTVWDCPFTGRHSPVSLGRGGGLYSVRTDQGQADVSVDICFPVEIGSRKILSSSSRCFYSWLPVEMAFQKDPTKNQQGILKQNPCFLF